MGSRNVPRDELKALGLPHECDGGQILSDRVTNKGRWSITHEIIWRMDDQPVGVANRATYRIAATEQQDERPWEYEPLVIVEEVHEIDRVVKVWEPKP